MIKKYFILLVLIQAAVGAHAGPLPQFTSAHNNKYRLEVGPDNTHLDRLRVTISELMVYDYKNTFLYQVGEAGFPVDEAYTVQFLIPAQACNFEPPYVFECNSARLTKEELAKTEVTVYGYSDTKEFILQLAGPKSSNRFSVKFYTTFNTSLRLWGNGKLEQSKTVGFFSDVWIYSSKQLHGQFFHKAPDIRL